MVRRRNVIGAINAAASALSYVRKGAGVLRKVKQYTGNLKRAANRVFRPSFRRLRFRKAVPRFRKRRRLFRRRLRRRRVRGVPSIPRRNVYTRHRKGIRRGNTGVLSLQKRIQAGHSLPIQTFARVYFRGSGQVIFDNQSLNQGRVLILNRLNSGPVLGSTLGSTTTSTLSLYGQVMYRDFWKMLYEDYLVLGATCRIKINPLAYPSTLVGRSDDLTPSDIQLPDGVQPGYWYARVQYQRRAGNADEVVGHQIATSGSGDERLWAHERDFLADPTVVWVRDRSRVRTKIIRTNVQQGISGTDYVPLSSTGIEEDGQFRVSHETEMSTRPVYLRINYSAKKHFDVKDILNEGPWATFSSSNLPFKVRVGYIGFTGGGNESYHVPLDRVREKEVTYDVKYFVALRGPKLNPNMYTDVDNLAAIEARRKGIPIEEAETDVPEDDDDFLSELEDEFDPPDEVAEGGMPPDETV